jgi:hypothetical protein
MQAEPMVRAPSAPPAATRSLTTDSYEEKRASEVTKQLAEWSQASQRNGSDEKAEQQQKVTQQAAPAGRWIEVIIAMDPPATTTTPTSAAAPVGKPAASEGQVEKKALGY